MHLRKVTDAESIEVLECSLHQLGYSAHLAWTRGDFRRVLRHVEEAHAILEERGGSHFSFASSRLYLSEQVAFRLARKGFEDQPRHIARARAEVLAEVRRPRARSAREARRRETRAPPPRPGGFV